MGDRGGIIGRQGGATIGGAIFGACGAVTGLGLSLIVLGGSLALGLAGLLTGLLYGAIGGLLIGYVFPNEIRNED